MAGDLQSKCNAILDDDNLDEEQRIEAVEDLISELNPEASRTDVERLVLDTLWEHRRAGKASSKTRVVGSRNSKPIKLPPKPAKTSKKGWQTLEESGLDQGFEETEQAKSPFDLLREILGKNSTDADIERVLSHNQFDIGKTINFLSSVHSATQPSADPQPVKILSREQTASKVVCKYFLQSGSCMRGSDCMYKHDISSRLCRFWLQGRCLAGERCAFLHTVPNELVEELQTVSNTRLPTKIPVFDTGTLPKLGDKKPKRSVHANPAKPSPDPSLLPQATSFLANGVSKFSIPASKSTLVLRPPLRLPWEHPEYLNNKQYLELRGSAQRNSEARNKYLQLATDSWASNDPATAKALSKKGQAFNKKMIDDYRAAAKCLEDQSSTPGSDLFVDLLGMEIGEAIDHLELVLDDVAATQKHIPRPLYVISGRGHYKVKRYVDHLTQQVKALLDEHAYLHKDFGEYTGYGRVIGIDPFSSLKNSSA